MKWKVSCPSPTLLSPLLLFLLIPFNSLLNSFDTARFQRFRMMGSGWRTRSLIFIILPVVLSNTAIAKWEGSGVVRSFGSIVVLCLPFFSKLFATGLGLTSRQYFSVFQVGSYFCACQVSVPGTVTGNFLFF